MDLTKKIAIAVLSTLIGVAGITGCSRGPIKKEKGIIFNQTSTYEGFVFKIEKYNAGIQRENGSKVPVGFIGSEARKWSLINDIGDTIPIAYYEGKGNGWKMYEDSENLTTSERGVILKRRVFYYGNVAYQCDLQVQRKNRKKVAILSDNDLEAGKFAAAYNSGDTIMIKYNPHEKEWKILENPDL